MALIVGAQKAGTTQLFEGLLHHPRCVGSVRKELNYFSYLLPPAAAGVPLPAPFVAEGAPRRWNLLGGVALLPAFAGGATAHGRCAAGRPDDWCFSRSVIKDVFTRQHLKTRRRENRSFSDAVHDILGRGTLAAEPGAALKKDAPPMLDYISWTYYALHLEALWRVYPRVQTLVLDSADIFDDTNAACQRVFSFLGLEPFHVTIENFFNHGSYRETSIRRSPKSYVRITAHMTNCYSI